MNPTGAMLMQEVCARKSMSLVLILSMSFSFMVLNLSESLMLISGGRHGYVMGLFEGCGLWCPKRRNKKKVL